MLRRFQDFQWGPLNATRLNELVDSITSLQQQVRQMQTRQEPGKDMILARIDDDGFTLQTGGRNVPAVAYPFSEVGLAITPDGDTNGASSVSYENIPGGITSTNGAVLLSFEQSPSMKRDDVVIAHYAPMIVAHADKSRKTVYMVKTMPRPSMGLYEVVDDGDGLGKYLVVPDGESSPVTEMENIYETSGYYGALDEPQNECAELVPRTLRVGDKVLGFTVGELLYTCAPTAFGVACQPCGSNPVTATAVAQDTKAAEILSAELMLRG